MAEIIFSAILGGIIGYCLTKTTSTCTFHRLKGFSEHASLNVVAWDVMLENIKNVDDKEKLQAIRVAHLRTMNEIAKNGFLQ
jgi:hypothetical protein